MNVTIEMAYKRACEMLGHKTVAESFQGDELVRVSEELARLTAPPPEAEADAAGDEAEDEATAEPATVELPGDPGESTAAS